jgi:hypothetical protein
LHFDEYPAAQGANTDMEKTISTIPKSQREELRVSLTEYQGHDLVDVRVYFRAHYDCEDKPMKPGKKGIAVKIGQLPDLISALQAAQTEARAAGLLDAVQTVAAE